MTTSIKGLSSLEEWQSEWDTLTGEVKTFKVSYVSVVVIACCFIRKLVQNTIPFCASVFTGFYIVSISMCVYYNIASLFNFEL